LLIFLLGVQTGCKKNDNNPDPIKKNYVWAVGTMDSTQHSLIYFSPDGGGTWTRQGEGADALKNMDLSDVWAVDENTVWAVGFPNTIIQTRDGGQSWSRVSGPTQKTDIELFSVSMIGSDDIWISGSHGTIYHSANGGTSWKSIQSDVLTNRYLQGIHAINKNVVYAVGGFESNSRGFIARTMDGGQTWDSIQLENNYNRHRWIGVSASDADHILVYGGQSHFALSTNGGINWTNDSIQGTGGTGGADINCLKMVDSQTYWGAFDYDGIYITNDGGSNWTSQGPAPGPEGMWLYGIDYYDKNLAVIVAESSMSNRGKIIQTNNGGQLWELRLETPVHMKKVSFIK
jgi:photosystem II stability/assembly factor-like uncharacterized protein